MSKAPGMDGYVKTRWGFFVREGESEIDDNYTYSDGREIEENILSILKNAKDLSSLSVELQKKIIDWPTSYYLSPRRANLLRPVESLLQGRVLEVGAGCGALTRYLGEVAQDVVAIEGSAARASAAVERVRDLKNSTVVRGLIQDFRCDQPFDAVICVGVLEYARVYVDSPDPELTLLNMMRSNLTPNGVLVLAIENQLGLKYFSGSLEDHYGAPFFGVNDSYRRDGVTTFGRVELSKLLREAGFESLEVLAPLPDYKLPVSVVRADADPVFEDVKSRLLEQSVSADQQNAAHPTFSLERAWPVVNRNGLLPDLANSFLLVASRDAVVPEGVSAWHYSVDRHPAFAKETRFVVSDGAGQIERRALSEMAAPDVPLAWDIGDSPYITGTNWWTECARILNTDGWGLPDLVAWARVWIDAICAELSIPAGSNLFDALVDGRAFDMVPQNLVVNEQGANFFDIEWCVNQKLPLGLVIVRGIRDSIAKLSSCAYTASDVTFRVNELVLSISAGIGVLISKSQLNAMAELDLRVQSWVRGDAAAAIDFDSVERDWSRTLNVRNPADRDLLSHHLNELRSELISTVDLNRSGIESLQAERDETLSILEQRLQDVTRQLDDAREAAVRDQKMLSELWKAEEKTFQARISDLSSELSQERSRSGSAMAEAAFLRSEIESMTRTAVLDQESYARALHEAEEMRRRIAADAEHMAARLQEDHNREMVEAEARHRSELEWASQITASERERHAYDLIAAELRAQQLVEAADRSIVIERDASRERETELLKRLELSDHQLHACIDIIEALRYLGSRLKVAERRSAEAEQLIDRLYRHQLLPQEGRQDPKALSIVSQQQSGHPAGMHASHWERGVGDDAVSPTAKGCDCVTLTPRKHDVARSFRSKFRKFLSKKKRHMDKILGPLGRRGAMSSKKDVDLLRDAGLVRCDHYRKLYPEVPADEVAVLKHYFSGAAGEGASPHPVFDPTWYRHQSNSAAEADIDPIAHYLTHGWLLGRSPHPLFDSSWYLARNPDVATSGVNPLTHYLRYGWREGRNPHPLFDGEWYVQQEPALLLTGADPLTHYLEEGWLDRRSPHPLFNAVWYDHNHPDVSQAGVNPLVHYVQNGWREGRLAHPLFDAAAYLKHNPDVAEAGVDPLLHYVEHGWREGRCPHPLFSSYDYMEPHRIAHSAVGGGLMYFVRGGWQDGISPHPLFDLQWYLAQKPTLGVSGYQDPLSHYLAVGSRSGMSASPVLNEDAIKSAAGEDSRAALLIFMDGLDNQNDFTLTKKNRWSKTEYAKYRADLQFAADRLNGGA
nr:methyltransferase [uncultured Brevundimonas sp.]